VYPVGLRDGVAAQDSMKLEGITMPYIKGRVLHWHESSAAAGTAISAQTQTGRPETFTSPIGVGRKGDAEATVLVRGSGGVQEDASRGRVPDFDRVVGIAAGEVGRKARPAQKLVPRMRKRTSIVYLGAKTGGRRLVRCAESCQVLVQEASNLLVLTRGDWKTAGAVGGTFSAGNIQRRIIFP
jgi:hypothetical protein